MKDRLPVSVIIPCYCSSQTIERAFYSVLDQTILPAEVIFVDDASPDEGMTLSILRSIRERYCSFMDIKIIILDKNSGPATARNRGWSEATQPFIAFLDSDDSWHPEKLELQYGIIIKNPEIALVGCKSIVVDKEDISFNESLRYKDLKLKEIGGFEMLISNRFSTPSVMLRRDVPFRFIDGKRQAEDYQLWLRIVFSRFKAVRIEYPLVFLHKSPFGEAGLSSHLIEHEIGELDTYKSLYREGLLNLPCLILIAIYSFMKFLRRCLITFIKRSI